MERIESLVKRENGRTGPEVLKWPGHAKMEKRDHGHRPTIRM